MKGRLPSGVVTFVFTDIEGSTRLWAENADAMKVALARHDELIGAAAAALGGHVFSAAGDSFGIAFERPASALDFAVNVRDEISREIWPESIEMRVRAGMHTGESDERDGDYFGSAVNLAARIEAAGHGGQILVSAVAAALLERNDVLELGRFWLKDVPAMQSIFQVGDERFAPLRTVDSQQGNLPRRLDRLIGRAEELLRLDELVMSSSLVTLVGPGGIGKTRLALEVARRATSSVPGGAWFVELAPIVKSEDVVRVVANGLGVNETGGKPLIDMVVSHLERRSVLLLLDNCEHVIEGASRLAAELLVRASGVRILATSREGLAIAGEKLVAVAPLDAASEATELFAERAVAVDPSFDLGAWRGPVEEVCRRLDGVPLAVELAASRVRTLSPPELAARLDDRFRLLTAGRRSSIERHRTLRETVQWSFDLLEPDEQLLFARVSVFVGWFGLLAAEAVGTDDQLDDIEVDDLLQVLVDRSMVSSAPGPFGRRFRLLETMRQFGAEHLRTIGEVDKLGERHASWCAGEVASIATMLEGHDEIAGVARLAESWDNIRAAHEWACVAGDIELAVSLVNPISLELYWRGRAEIGSWIERILEIPGSNAHSLGPLLVDSAAGRYRWNQDLAGLESFEQRYGEVSRRGIEWNRSYLEGRFEDFRGQAESVAGVMEDAGWYYLARCTRFGGETAMLRLGLHDEYHQYLEETAQIAEREGPPTILNLCRQGQAVVAIIGGDPARAAAIVATASAIEVPATTVTLLPVIGTVDLFDRGGRTRALAELRTAIQSFIDAENHYYLFYTSAVFATLMARFDRPPDVARAAGVFRSRSTGMIGLEPLTAEAESYLIDHDDDDVRRELVHGAELSPQAALVYMAEVLDGLTTSSG